MSDEHCSICEKDLLEFASRNSRILELEHENSGLREALQIAHDTLEWIAADNLHGGHLATDATEYMYGNSANHGLERSRKALKKGRSNVLLLENAKLRNEVAWAGEWSSSGVLTWSIR